MSLNGLTSFPALQFAPALHYYHNPCDQTAKPDKIGNQHPISRRNRVFLIGEGSVQGKYKADKDKCQSCPLHLGCCGFHIALSLSNTAINTFLLASRKHYCKKLTFL
jgi:hypothetical protein